MMFVEKLEAAGTRNRSMVCVGLDPDPDRLPPHLKGRPEAVAEFTAGIVSATSDLACAYKPNFAFFGALGPRDSICSGTWSVVSRRMYP